MATIKYKFSSEPTLITNVPIDNHSITLGAFKELIKNDLIAHGFEICSVKREENDTSLTLLTDDNALLKDGNSLILYTKKITDQQVSQLTNAMSDLNIFRNSANNKPPNFNQEIFINIFAIVPSLYPTVREVQDLLLQPLPAPIPFPHLHLLELNNLSESLAYEMKAILRSVSAGYHDWVPAILSAVNGLSIRKDEGEGSLSSVVQTFIKAVIRPYAEHKFHEFGVHFANNKACTLVTTTKNPNNTTTRIVQVRPDFICYLDTVPILIQQEKESNIDENYAIKQLEECTGLMLDQFFGKIPFVLACTVSGKFVKFFGYFRKDNVIQDQIQVNVDLSKPKLIQLEKLQFNLSLQVDRVIMFKVLVNVVRFYHGCYVNQFFPNPPEIKLKRTPRSFNTFVNLKGDTSTGDIIFVKTFENFDSYEPANPQNLYNLFSILRSSSKAVKPAESVTTRADSFKSIRHTYKNFKCAKEPKKNGLFVVVESKYCKSNCLEYITTMQEAKKMLIHVAECLQDLHSYGFVHRDVRLSNIIFDDKAKIQTIENPSVFESGEFLLIDFDHSDKTGERLRVEHAAHPDYLKILDENDQLPRYYEKDDIFTLGMLIENLQVSKGEEIVPKSFTELAMKLKNNTYSLSQFVKDLQKLK